MHLGQGKKNQWSLAGITSWKKWKDKGRQCLWGHGKHMSRDGASTRSMRVSGIVSREINFYKLLFWKKEQWDKNLSGKGQKKDNGVWTVKFGSNVIGRTCSFINNSRFVCQLDEGWIGRGRGETDVRKNSNAFANIKLYSIPCPSWAIKDLFSHLLGVPPADNSPLSVPFGDSSSERESTKHHTPFPRWPTSRLFAESGEIFRTPIYRPPWPTEACFRLHWSLTSPSVQSCFLHFPSPVDLLHSNLQLGVSFAGNPSCEHSVLFFFTEL